MKCKKIYFTGPIDAYFASSGMEKLEYRSLRFDRHVYQDTDYYQPTAHVNYPSLKYNFTRAIEYKHILNQSSQHTVVFFEYSSDRGEPYYPVPNRRNLDLYAKYQSLAENQDDVTFVGRLANYKYFNMDETVANALALFDESQPKVEFESPCSLGILINGFEWNSLAMNKLLDSLRESPFLNLAVTQGNRTELIKVTNQLYNLRVQHNEFDWTALLAVAELQDLLRHSGILKEYWFYLHETSSVGANFTGVLREHCPTFTHSRHLTKFPSMNMGLYSNTDLVNNVNFLLSKKSQISFPTPEELNTLKGLAVESEDDLFRKIFDSMPSAPDPFSNRVKMRRKKDIYGTGAKRITEYFPAVDVYKYKANFKLKENGENWVVESLK